MKRSRFIKRAAALLVARKARSYEQAVAMLRGNRK